jgi:hypothetical protein
MSSILVELSVDRRPLPRAPLDHALGDVITPAGWLDTHHPSSGRMMDRPVRPCFFSNEKTFGTGRRTIATIRASGKSARIHGRRAMLYGFGFTPVEAMAGGCALVTTSNGGSDDYAFDDVTALVTQPRDVRAMADGIERLLVDDQTRVRLAVRGNEFVKRFDWDASARLLEAFLRRFKSDPRRYQGRADDQVRRQRTDVVVGMRSRRTAPAPDDVASPAGLRARSVGRTPGAPRDRASTGKTRECPTGYRSAAFRRRPCEAGRRRRR